MDTSDPNIVFDENGISDYYHNFQQNILPNWNPQPGGHPEIHALAEAIRNEGKGREHDCIIGVSGGLDSSYAVYLAKEKLGLRPLLFHVDAGWNTSHAVSNIEKIVDGLGLDLYTEVINWEEMKDLQRAYLKAQVPDQDIQDIAFFSALYKYARKHRFKYIITGSNVSTECVREPEEWGAYVGLDTRLIYDIHRRFGERKLSTFPILDIFTYKILHRYLLGMKIVKPLDYFPFRKEQAEEELSRLFGWKKFQHKHHESRFTRFIESYWFPKKFGFEKRRAHFSSLILTGQMTREAALERISRPELDEEFMQREFEYVAHKLDFSVEELQAIMNGTNRPTAYYKNKRALILFGAKAMRFLGMEKRLFR